MQNKLVDAIVATFSSFYVEYVYLDFETVKRERERDRE